LLANPKKWPHWPFLPLTRNRPDSGQELGVVFDALHAADLPGYSSTVFFANLYLLPATPTEFLALPREVFDTPQELVDAGWLVN
jgi:hypothetical protein